MREHHTNNDDIFIIESDADGDTILAYSYERHENGEVDLDSIQRKPELDFTLPPSVSDITIRGEQ